MPTDRRDLFASVLPISRSLRRIEDAAAATHGLTMWQYAILSVIASQPGLNQGEVASLMDYSKNRIIGDLDHLEAKGLLLRRPGTDRRANVLEATHPGIAMMQQIRAEIHRGEDTLLAGLSVTARRDFERAARTLGDQLRGQ